MEFIAKTVVKCLVEKGFNCEYSQILQRTKTVQSQAKSGKRRTEKEHRESLDINVNQNVKETVIILDDVWTTGLCMQVCSELIKNNGCKNTICVVIGTTSDQ